MTTLPSMIAISIAMSWTTSAPEAAAVGFDAYRAVNAQPGLSAPTVPIPRYSIVIGEEPPGAVWIGLLIQMPSLPTVRIDANGRIEYGPGYEPDAAARGFWAAVANEAAKHPIWPVR